MQRYQLRDLPLERSWNLSLVFFFLQFQGLKSFPNEDSFPRCCRAGWEFWVLAVLSTTTSGPDREDDFSRPSTGGGTCRNAEREREWWLTCVEHR